jgi:hypothetical protein
MICELKKEGVRMRDYSDRVAETRMHRSDDMIELETSKEGKPSE